MHTSRRTIDDRRYSLNIWLPHAVAAPVGVADLDSKNNTFVAIFTFSHLIAPPACTVSLRKIVDLLYKDNASNNIRTISKMQEKFSKRSPFDTRLIQTGGACFLKLLTPHF